MAISAKIVPWRNIVASLTGAMQHSANFPFSNTFWDINSSMLSIFLGSFLDSFFLFSFIHATECYAEHKDISFFYIAILYIFLLLWYEKLLATADILLCKNKKETCKRVRSLKTLNAILWWWKNILFSPSIDQFREIFIPFRWKFCNKFL